jgi:hypothetical protein
MNGDISTLKTSMKIVKRPPMNPIVVSKLVTTLSYLTPVVSNSKMNLKTSVVPGLKTDWRTDGFTVMNLVYSLVENNPKRESYRLISFN